jgi:hypothetical protein
MNHRCLKIASARASLRPAGIRCRIFVGFDFGKRSTFVISI